MPIIFEQKQNSLRQTRLKSKARLRTRPAAVKSLCPTAFSPAYARPLSYNAARLKQNFALFMPLLSAMGRPMFIIRQIANMRGMRRIFRAMLCEKHIQRAILRRISQRLQDNTGRIRAQTSQNRKPSSGQSARLCGSAPDEKLFSGAAFS